MRFIRGLLAGSKTYPETLIPRALIAVLAGASLGGCGDLTEPASVAASLEILAGDGQEEYFFTSLPDSLRLMVRDSEGSPVRGAVVTWNTGFNSGAISPSVDTSDALGVVAAQWSFRDASGKTATLGTHTATATVAGVVPATFTAYAREGVKLRSVAITPDSVDVTSSSATVNVKMRFTNDWSQLDSVISVIFYDPTAVGATTFDVLVAGLKLSSGIRADGIWEGTTTVPMGAEGGVWTLGRITVGWGCGSTNRMEIFDPWLKSMGMPYQLHVTGGPPRPALLPAMPGPMRSTAPLETSLRRSCS
ncbi:MAG: Ig-like domain-containing protein [Gemmatimonadaceae bacterium]|nr:Ig-like domain-containing protein [Gemmatimonadaceae bacterium]